MQINGRRVPRAAPRPGQTQRILTSCSNIDLLSTFPPFQSSHISHSSTARLPTQTGAVHLCACMTSPQPPREVWGCPAALPGPLLPSLPRVNRSSVLLGGHTHQQWLPCAGCTWKAKAAHMHSSAHVPSGELPREGVAQLTSPQARGCRHAPKASGLKGKTGRNHKSLWLWNDGCIAGSDAPVPDGIFSQLYARGRLAVKAFTRA